MSLIINSTSSDLNRTDLSIKKCSICNRNFSCRSYKQSSNTNANLKCSTCFQRIRIKKQNAKIESLGKRCSICKRNRSYRWYGYSSSNPSNLKCAICSHKICTQKQKEKMKALGKKCSICKTDDSSRWHRISGNDLALRCQGCRMKIWRKKKKELNIKIQSNNYNSLILNSQFSNVSKLTPLTIEQLINLSVEREQDLNKPEIPDLEGNDLFGKEILFLFSISEEELLNKVSNMPLINFILSK